MRWKLFESRGETNSPGYWRLRLVLGVLLLVVGLTPRLSGHPIWLSLTILGAYFLGSGLVVLVQAKRRASRAAGTPPVD